MVGIEYTIAYRFEDPRIWGSLLTDPSQAWQPKWKADLFNLDDKVCGVV